MDPWKSWAIVGIVGAGAAYYYSQSGKSKKGIGQISSILGDQSRRRGSASTNDSKSTRKRKGKGKASGPSDQAASDLAEASSSSAKASSIEKAKKREGGKQQPSKLSQSSAVTVANVPDVEVGADDGEDEAMSNKEFALQLSGLKTGTPLKKPDSAIKETKKTKRQNKSTEMPPEATNDTVIKPNVTLNTQEASTASSTTGADADDDLSLPVSPEFGASRATTPSGADVTDMLETPAKGPSVLRLMESTNQQPARQPKAQKPKPEPETKKQRQNRQKNEERKAILGQAEKERRILLENQLRTAREAEGRPTRNGLGGSNAPSTSAWNKPTSSAGNATVGSAAAPPKSHDGSLLDTFDDDKSFLGDAPPMNGGAPSTSEDEPAHGVRNGMSTDGKVNGRASTDQATWGEDVPSEEEQIRLIGEMDSDHTWKTVSKAKGKKRSTTMTSAVNGNRPNASRTSKNPLGTERVSLSAITNNSAANNNLSSMNVQTSSEADDTESSPTATETMPPANRRIEDKDSSSATDVGRPEDPRTKFPHLDFEGGIFDKEDINDQGVSKYFRGKLLPNGKPDYDDPDYERNWVPGMSVHCIYRPSPKHLGFKDDGVTMKETFKTIDHDVWTRENIQDHPDYDPAWPYALTGHPMDSDWVGDWDTSDMEKADAKRAKQEATPRAERMIRSKKETKVENQHGDDY